MRFDKFLTALPVPFCIGSGNFLYPVASGFMIALSRPWFNANVALFNFSKQSLTSVDWPWFKLISPSDPAFALNVNKKIESKVMANFLNILNYILYSGFL